MEIETTTDRPAAPPLRDASPLRVAGAEVVPADMPLESLIACPECDALHRDADVPVGQKALCIRCGATLFAPRANAMTDILMLAAAALILMVAAVFFPFLEIHAAGLGQRSSVLDAILAFSDGLMLPLSFAVAALIVLLPVTRFALLVYVFAPMALGHEPARHAAWAFRQAERMRPWAMAEIFIVGVAVALVKVAGLASLTLGPAFWAFVALVVVTVLKDNLMDRFSVWQTLERRRPS